MIDYTYQYKTALDLQAIGNGDWDIFISTFNPSERVLAVFDEVRSARKHWLVHHEYGLGRSDVSDGAFISNEIRENDFILEFFTSIAHETSLAAARICVDVTGFIRPNMIYLINYLRVLGVSRFDVIYTEPGHYSGHGRTRFASTTLAELNF